MECKSHFYAHKIEQSIKVRFAINRFGVYFRVLIRRCYTCDGCAGVVIAAQRKGEIVCFLVLKLLLLLLLPLFINTNLFYRRKSHFTSKNIKIKIKLRSLLRRKIVVSSENCKHRKCLAVSRRKRGELKREGRVTCITELEWNWVISTEH